MNTKFIKLSVCTVLFATISYAQEQDSLKINQLNEVVVSDTKFAQSKEKSGKIIEKITAEDLAKRPGQSVATVLSQVAGVEINGNQSANSKNQGIYIRGGRNRQVAIYIDGVPVNDASNINSEYDLRLLNVDMIESIEILKGASSTLYGSGAATGVINITLKKSSNSKLSGNAFFALGTQNTSEDSKTKPQDFNQGFSVNGTLGKVTYLTSLSSTETKGFSEAFGENYEEDTFSRVNVLQKIGFKATDKLSFDFFGNYDKINNTFDTSYAGSTVSNDDVYNNGNSEQFRIGFSPKYKYNKGELVLNASAATIDREINLFSSWTNTVDNYSYSSRSINADLFNKYTFSSQFFAIIGVQTQYFDMTQVDAYTNIEREGAKFNIIDPYVTVVYNSNFGLNVNAGLRLNIHSEYETYYMLNINPSYNFKNIPLKILSSISAGYITPSLYQLYSVYGNLDLKPEENATAELGFETNLFSKRLMVNAVGFYREETNSVGFYTDPITWTSNYINIDGTYNAKGVETSVKYNFNDKLTANANYTFTEVEQPLSRLIAKHKANAGVDYMFSERASFGLQYQFVDKRNDAFYNSTLWANENVSLAAYQLVNANFRLSVIKNRLSLFGAVNNILNEEFQENIGYATKGRNYKLGLNFQF
ncbi:TonB-dependent receptor plug domain-containing protein [Flavobacterium sp. N2270]|uniref:TonB-dependent receptor plug domain-containing protein n=1 Tax=Flavobacterium sp. N2270 TaxID=2986831 RepID=UPI0022255B43|nr:TonB-dependent receptor plug domain-containing protein [Flavobacterium sp. N2270]